MIIANAATDFNVVYFVIITVALSDRIGRGSSKGVEVGNVRGDTTEVSGRASVSVDLGEELGGRGQISRPAQPSSMTSIDVHGNTNCVKFLDSVNDTLLVSALGVSTFLDIQICDQISERVRLNDSHDGYVREL